MLIIFAFALTLDYVDREIELNQDLEYFKARQRFMSGIKLKQEYYFNITMEDTHLFHIKQLLYPSQFLLVTQSNDTIYLINQLGMIVAQYTHNFNIFESDYYFTSDEFYIGIQDSDNNMVSLGLNITRIKDPQDDIRLVDSQGYWDRFEFEIESSFNLQFKPSSFYISSGRNTKIFLIADQMGCISYYFQNGTIKNKNAISTTEVKIFRRHPHAMFYTNKTIGFFNAISLQIIQPKCDTPSNNIINVYQENIFSQNVFVQLSNMDILVYQIKTGKHQECTIQYKIPAQVTHRQLRLVNSYLIGIDDVLTVYNTSIYRTQYLDDLIVLTSLDDKRIPNIYHGIRSQRLQTFTSAAYEVLNTQNGSVVRYLEMTHQAMQINSGFSLFESFRFPMILVALFVVFIFQFWQKKKKTDYDSNDEITSAAKKKIDQMVREYQQKEKPE